MSLPISAFVGPSLGLVPDIGPFLAAAYSNIQTDKYNLTVLDDLDNISTELQTIENEIAVLKAKESVKSLGKSMKEAPSQVAIWYNTAKPWLIAEATDPSKTPLTAFEKKDIINALSAMHLAAIGKLPNSAGVNLDWMKILIHEYKAEVAGETNTQSISLLEKSYRTYLWIVQIQIKAILCLRTVKISPVDLAEQVYLLLNNLIEQGKHIQETVINEEIKNNEAAFVWFQINNANPSPSRFINTAGAIDFLNGEQNFNQAISGVEFHESVGGTTGVGLKVATADINKHGNLTESTWQEMTWSTTPESLGSPTVYIATAAQNMIVEPGQIITGVTFKTAEPAGEGGVNRIYFGVNVMNLDHDGNLTHADSLTQSPSRPMSNVPNPNLGLNQFTAASIPCADSPITGMYFSVTGGHQVVIAMQTSIHQNAFKAYSSSATDYIGIKSMYNNEYLVADTGNDTIGLGAAFAGTQKFIIKNANDTPISYGDKVNIRTGSLYLTEKTIPGAQTVVLAPEGEGDYQWWELLDPNDDPNDFTNNGEITNWSAVIVRNVLTQSCLYAAAPGNNLAKLPKTTPVTPATTPPTTTALTCTINPLFVWNLTLRQ